MKGLLFRLILLFAWLGVALGASEDSLARPFVHSTAHWDRDFESGISSGADRLHPRVETMVVDEVDCMLPLRAVSVVHVTCIGTGADGPFAPPVDCLLDVSTFSPRLLNPRFISFTRVGEAANPGPASQLLVSVSNPSGLRQKEEIVLSHGPGIFSLCETQCSRYTQHSCKKRLRSLAMAEGRIVRPLFGAPAALRAGSSWAGTWTGVATISDFVSRPLTLSWQSHEYESGRLLATQHFVQGVCLTKAVVYGYPSSPTWPRSRALTTELLGVVTHDIVLGARGPRIIAGDFNASSTELSVFDTWRRLGWQSAQTWALDHWHQPVRMTYKGQTEPDQVWMSPEAQALCTAVRVLDHFMEHSTVQVQLDMLRSPGAVLRWTRPSVIPVAEVDDAWPSSQPASLPDSTDSNVLFQVWARSYESSFDGHLCSQPGSSLTPQQRGRFQHCSPSLHRVSNVVCRPSREGEVRMRNSLLGTSVVSWFRQLRRLQSYVHAIRAAKSSSSAVVYRLELWSAILAARGFDHSFSWWWQHFGWEADPCAPAFLPSQPPDVATAEAIFAAFRCRYEQFEAWHLNQRNSMLKQKHDRTLGALYQDLRKPAPEQLDGLCQEQVFSVIGFDNATHQIQLDEIPSLSGTSTWYLDGEPVSLLHEQDDLCTLVPWPLVSIDSTLLQRQFFTTAEEVHSQLLSFWQKRWLAASPLPSELWDRVVAFFRAFIPQVSFDLPDLSVRLWRAALRRYKPRCARGVDGFSPAELLCMPDSWTAQLLTLLHAIERGHLAWPAAILYGTVFSLAKSAAARLPGDYRPVVIFSVIYRTWAGIKARALIQQLEPFVSAEAYGFLPHREAAQYWMGVQGHVELCLLLDRDLFGFSSDLCKAFEHIPRPQTWALAAHLQVPASVTLPWKSFLDNCQRAFDYHGVLSEASGSSVGVPEGDALSVFAMVQLDFSYHVYMAKFSPRAIASTYVDNIGVRSNSVAALIAGFVTTSSFYQLWNLELDPRKTFVWATKPALRNQLRLMPCPCRETAAELGGSMSFTARSRNQHQADRLHSLADKWQRLRLSAAPLCLKLRSLGPCFWSQALHGAPSSRFSASWIAELRTQAMRALRLSKTGSNPMLRLTLSGPWDADPGFFQLKTTVLTFRRVCLKMEHFCNDWSTFMCCYTGILGQGPYSKILEQLHLVGWRLYLPHVWDHDDLCHDLLQWDDASLVAGLHEAWLQHVAFEACRRPSMTGLQGLDSALLADLHKGVSALHHSLQCSLHSGTFVDAAHHAKFDLAKTAWCSQCDCKDDQAHWWRCPRFSEFRRRSQLTPEILEAAPGHVSWHLLPSRNPTRRWFREYFHMRPNELAFVGTAIQPLEHVFTDGSSKKLDCGLSYASWAAISASSGQLISAAHLAGVDQTAARAEVSAVFAAVEWGAWQHIQLHLWVDSLFVVDNLHYLLRTGHVPLHWKHRDLWGRIHTALEQSEYPPLVTWIPSHIDPEACEDPWQDWVAAWNSKVDLCAGEMNERRSAEFWEQVTQAEEYHRTTLTLLTQVRSFYCHVAASSAESSTERAQVPESTASFDFEWVIDRNALSSQLPPVFEPMLERCAVTLPLTFLSSLLHLFLRWETQADGMYGCSFVELLVLLQRQGLPFPLCNPSTNQWELVPLARMPVRPTISSLIRLLRVAIGSIAEVFDISEMLSLSLNKLELGISAPVAGIFLMLPAALVRHARGGLLTITRGWPLRRAADYARPLPPGHSMG